MASRSVLARNAHLALRWSVHQRRGLAAAASTSASASSSIFETSEIAGIKLASRDAHGPTTKLVVVAKAGTRYQPLPGLTVGLEEFAFKNTHRRSALRITRESELLGGQLTAYHTREALVIEANFLRGDLPYFAELLGEVITQTKYTTHEFHEEVERVIHVKEAEGSADAAALALDAAHGAAFHTGLGAPLYPTVSTPTKPYLSEHSLAAFAEAVYAKPNIAIVADGASAANMSKWVDVFFKNVPSASSGAFSLDTTPSKYHGGEQRTSLAGGNSMVIAFPGSSIVSPKPELSVLAALLGGQPSIKWTPGFSLLSKVTAAAHGATAKAASLAYSDAGLFAIQITGSAPAVRAAAAEAVKALKSVADGTVSKEVLAKAIAKAKFDVLDESQLRVPALLAAGSGLIHGGKPYAPTDATKAFDSVTADKLKAAAKSMLGGKATVSTVGDLYALPYGQDLGLVV